MLALSCGYLAVIFRLSSDYVVCLLSVKYLGLFGICRIKLYLCALIKFSKILYYGKIRIGVLFKGDKW